MHRLRVLIRAAFPIVTVCSIGDRFLVPSATWVTEPSALGLA
jgi:hypothetical protein